MLKKTLVLGVSGGIAVYKIPDLISRLMKRGLDVEVVMTKAATEFVTPLTFREVTQKPAHTEMFSDNMQWNVEHISVAKKADLLAIIPATANIIGKIANGIADDLLTTTVMAAKCPKIIAPAMNCNMYQNPVLQRNLNILVELGYIIVGPDSGRMLCGDEGPGRLATLEELEINILKHMTRQDLSGEVILVTAGGTREPIDPVRYIGNRSSGRMGHALAEAAFKRGAEVLLVTASDHMQVWKGINIFKVDTTLEMRDKVLELAPRASIIIKAAAPADYRPESVSGQKIKKTSANMNFQLIPNPDILLELGGRKSAGQMLIGFAAETNSLRDNAMDKLNRKNLDLIIGNLVNDPAIGMGALKNQVTIYSKTKSIELPEATKDLLADQILTCILNYRTNGDLAIS